MFLQRANPHTYSCGVGTPLAFQEEGPSELRGAGPKTGIPPAVEVPGAIAASGTASIKFAGACAIPAHPTPPKFSADVLRLALLFNDRSFTKLQKRQPEDFANSKQ